MPATDLQRIAEFQMSFARRQAAVVQEVPGGVVVLDPEYAASYEHNQLIIDGQPVGDGAVRSVELPELADKLLGHLPYRQITILDDVTGAAYASVLAGAGYEHEILLVMTHAGEVPVPDLAAEQVTVSELRPALIRELCAWLPQASDLVIDQMARRRTARLRGADEVRFLAAREPGGAIASWADLYLDQDLGIAQIEDVMTAEAYRRRGYSGAVLATALHQAAGCELVFLLAEADDWPRTWYARLGFTVIGRSHVFTRSPSVA
jgi:GNAT superfamily N-acetyltransferase